MEDLRAKLRVEQQEREQARAEAAIKRIEQLQQKRTTIGERVLARINRQDSSCGSYRTNIQSPQLFCPTTVHSIVQSEALIETPSEIPAVVLAGVLSKAECQALLSAIPFREGEPGYMSERDIKVSYRDRIMERYACHDPALSAIIEARIKDFIPQEIPENENSVICKVVGLSPEWRFLRYNKGGYQGVHVDGREHRNDAPQNVFSRMTVQMYLNECSVDFTGGNLRFYHEDSTTVKLDYCPRAGDCLLFYQEDSKTAAPSSSSSSSLHLSHEAMEVTSGEKYSMRCVVEYTVSYNSSTSYNSSRGGGSGYRSTAAAAAATTSPTNDAANIGIQIASDLHLEFYAAADSAGDSVVPTKAVEEITKEEQRLWGEILSPAAPILALLGDIGILTSENMRSQYTRFLDWCISKWEHVVILTGNHEYYRSSTGASSSHLPTSVYCVEDCDNFLRDLCTFPRFTGRLHYLQGDSVTLNGVTILGCTLWSSIPPSEGDAIRNTIWDKMNDYRLIYTSGTDTGATASATSTAATTTTTSAIGAAMKPITPDQTQAWHMTHVSWLKQQLAAIKNAADIASNDGDTPQEEIPTVVILTHHTPSMKGTSAPHHEGDPMNHAYSTDLLDIVAGHPYVKYWAHGHTHFNNCQIFEIPDSSAVGKEKKLHTETTALPPHRLKLVSNQSGYKGSWLHDYNPKFVI